VSRKGGVKMLVVQSEVCYYKVRKGITCWSAWPPVAERAPRIHCFEDCSLGRVKESLHLIQVSVLWATVGLLPLDYRWRWDACGVVGDVYSISNHWRGTWHPHELSILV